MSWDKDHWAFHCSDGWHDSFWKTVVESPQWEAWEKENAKRIHDQMKLPAFDVAECADCGWISAEHFQEFLKFVTMRKK